VQVGGGDIEQHFAANLQLVDVRTGDSPLHDDPAGLRFQAAGTIGDLTGLPAR
jgi:hypothetical protein